MIGSVCREDPADTTCVIVLFAASRVGHAA
jgi:hypothetical protein